MKPLITVIVPVYNGQDYLLNCMKCIQEQTYENVEIIVVDDGSSDDTPEICVELEEQSAAKYGEASSDRKRSIRCIRLNDEGVSVARNRALEQAAGEYVTFVDADDRIVPDLLQHLYEIMQKSGSDVAGCGFFMWSSEEQWISNAPKTGGEYGLKTYGPEEYVEQEILRGNTRCWSKLYRRNALEKVRFEPGLTIGEDMLFLVALKEHVHSVCESSYPGYGYYQNTSGVMKRKFTGRVMDQIYCWEKARGMIGASPLVDRHIVISVMLVVGRMAELSEKEREHYADEAACCRRKLKEYLSFRVFRLLDRGYKIKTACYLAAPRLYVNLYHKWKSTGSTKNR